MCPLSGTCFSNLSYCSLFNTVCFQTSNKCNTRLCVLWVLYFFLQTYFFQDSSLLLKTCPSHYWIVFYYVPQPGQISIIHIFVFNSTILLFQFHVSHPLFFPLFSFICLPMDDLRFYCSFGLAFYCIFFDFFFILR